MPMGQKDEHKHHEELVKGLYEQLKPIMEKSEQAMYLYLDDRHNAFNAKMAKLLGYNSVAEMAKVKETPLDAFVDPKSQEKTVHAFGSVVEKMAASNIMDISWKKKSGGTVKTNMVMVPITYNGHLFALHFLY